MHLISERFVLLSYYKVVRKDLYPGLLTGEIIWKCLGTKGQKQYDIGK